MMEYSVGCLGSLISGKKEEGEGPKIVYKSVQQIENKAQKQDLVSSIQKKGKSLKRNLGNILTNEKKPEVAASEDVGITAQSWNNLRSREEELEDDAVNTSTGKTESTFSQNAARRVHIKKNTKKFIDDPEREARTVFIGNVPTEHATDKKLTKFLSEYGKVESVRFRCVPLKDPRTTKKVAAITHEFHPARSSMNAYAVFKTPEEANAALQANGSIYHDHHLRVDLAGNNGRTEINPRLSVFIGNLSFVTEEEELWSLFSSCGSIKNVRIVRDPITTVSKGIAFINFENADSVELALEKNGELFKKRPISVKRYKSKTGPSPSVSGENAPRHKGSDPSNIKRSKQESKEEIRMLKKEKRKRKREEDTKMGIVKKKRKRNNMSGEDSLVQENHPTEHKKIETKEFEGEKKSSAHFQGQKTEKLKKKRKIDKGKKAKKKTAIILGTRKKTTVK